MEPAKLNSSDPADAKLEALLREQVSDVLPDEGFSQRVMALLPDAEPSRRAAILPPRPSRFLVWGRSDLWIVGAAIAAALILVPAFGGPSAGTMTDLHQLEAAFSPLIAAILEPHLLLVLSLTVGLLLLMSDETEETSLRND